MLNARKKLVSMAVASAISGAAMLASAPAQALNVSQNNVGQVLLFPYYTVKSGFDTLFTVTNTSNKAVAFKIRFREALNSREVRDFNVVLSPHDHWSGVVTAVGTNGAAVRTYDNSCTSPNKNNWTGVDVNGDGVTDGYSVAFTDALYTGAYADGVSATDNANRVQEGYFEVIEMGTSSVTTDTIYAGALHNSAGVPANCAAVDTTLNAGNTTFHTNWTAPENVLKGHLTYISVATGKAIDAEPVAIENFMTTNNIMFPAANVFPSLADGNVSSDAKSFSNGVIVDSGFMTDSADAVSAVLASVNVMNEFASGTTTQTSWVVTFPTKHFYTDSYGATGSNVNTSTTTFTPGDPFTQWFPDNGKSCDTYSLALYSREEKTVQSVASSNFSPAPAGPDPVSLCYEANVIDFNGSTVFGAGVNHTGIDTTGTTGVGLNGWARLAFTGEASGADVDTNGYSIARTAGGLVDNAGMRYLGLPAIGFAAVMRDNANGQANYGSSVAHAYRQIIVPAVP